MDEYPIWHADDGPMRTPSRPKPFRRTRYKWGEREWIKGYLTVSAFQTDWHGWSMFVEDQDGLQLAAFHFLRNFPETKWDCSNRAELEDWGVQMHLINTTRLDTLFHRVVSGLRRPSPSK